METKKRRGIWNTPPLSRVLGNLFESNQRAVIEGRGPQTVCHHPVGSWDSQRMIRPFELVCCLWTVASPVGIGGRAMGWDQNRYRSRSRCLAVPLLMFLRVVQVRVLWGGLLTTSSNCCVLSAVSFLWYTSFLPSSQYVGGCSDVLFAPLPCSCLLLLPVLYFHQSLVIFFYFGTELTWDSTSRECWKTWTHTKAENVLRAIHPHFWRPSWCMFWTSVITLHWKFHLLG